MNIFRPRIAVTLAEFHEEFKENVCIVCDFRIKTGRRRHSILGDRRTQIIKSVSTEIARAMVEKSEADGKIFEPAAQFFYENTARADWAAKKVNALAKVNYEATDEDDFRLVEKMFGRLITIEYRKPKVGRAEPIRILTKSATPFELRAASDIISKRSRRANKLGERAAFLLNRVADLTAEGEFFEDAMARHYDAIRRGQPLTMPTTSLDGEGDE